MTRYASLFRAGTAILGIIAVGLAGAIVEDSYSYPTGNGGGAVGGGSASPPEPAGVTEFPLLLELLILVVAVIVAGLCVLYFVANPLENVVVIAGICVVIAIIMGILLAANELLVDGTPSFRPSPSGEPATENQSSGGSNLETLIYGFLLIVTFFVTFAASLLYTRSTERLAGDSANGDDPGLSGETSAAVGAAAGRAADQIEAGHDVSVDNEIYRAWREMIGLLSVDRPDSTTPREFAAAAVDADLDRTDVEDLTDLFESVRYGDADSTSTRETRAVEILRRIESTYVEDAVAEGASR